MAIATPISQFIDQPLAVSIPATVGAKTRTYNRIVILFDACGEADQALRVALEIGSTHNLSITMIGTNSCNMKAYIDRKTRQLQEQEIAANGYTISGTISNLPQWILNTEQADAVIVAQNPVGWIGRMFGHDVAASLRSRTTADVFEVTV